MAKWPNEDQKLTIIFKLSPWKLTNITKNWPCQKQIFKFATLSEMPRVSKRYPVQWHVHRTQFCLSVPQEGTHTKPGGGALTLIWSWGRAAGFWKVSLVRYEFWVKFGPCQIKKLKCFPIITLQNGKIDQKRPIIEKLSNFNPENWQLN